LLAGNEVDSIQVEMEGQFARCASCFDEYFSSPRPVIPGQGSFTHR